MDILSLLFFVATLVIAFVLGGAYGWDLRERHATRVLQKFAHSVEKSIGAELENLIHINIEEHNGMLFVYDKQKNTFMAQGKDRKELEKNLQERFPDKRFACDHETLVKIGFIS